MSIAIVMFTDGREHVFDGARRRSWDLGLRGDVSHRLMFDDSGDPAFRARLLDEFPDWIVTSWTQRRGFGGTIRAAWQLLAPGPNAQFPEITHLFHLEDDFALLADVDLDALAGCLDRHPALVQLALRRQPWNDVEKQHGGIVEANPSAFDEGGDEHLRWLEHRLFFTTNPSLYRRSLCSVGWPKTGQSEGIFTHYLLERGTPEVAGDLIRFAFAGGRYSGEMVNHIGTLRAGTGY